MMRGFIKKRLLMEYAYFCLINDFFHVWEVDGFICEAYNIFFFLSFPCFGFVKNINICMFEWFVPLLVFL